MAAPVITAISPGEGIAGTQITITGSGFGATQATYSGYVSLFDAAIDSLTGTTWGTPTGVALVVDSWTDAEIVFTLPSPSGTGGEYALVAGTTAGVFVANSNGQTATFPIAIPPASPVAASTPGTYIEVLAQSPAPGAGIEVDIYEGGSLGTMLCTLENAYDVQFQDQYLAVGSGSFVISIHDPKATPANLAIGNLVKIKIDGVYRFAFFIEEPGYVWLDPAGPQNEVVTVAGRQAVSILDRAIVYPFHWPTDKTQLTNTFTLVTAANMMIYFIQAAQSRGGLVGVTWDFTIYVDSQNRKWLDSQTMNIPTGMSLLALMQQFVAMGVIFTMDDNLVLHGYAVYGQDRTSTVIMRAGRHIGTGQAGYQMPSQSTQTATLSGASALTPTEEKLLSQAAALEGGTGLPVTKVTTNSHTSPFKNVLLAVAPNGVVIEVTGPASTNPGIGRREGVFQYQLSDSPTQVQNAAQGLLAALQNGATPFQLPVLKGYDAGDYLPYVDYGLGDTIAVDIPGAEGLSMAALQIVSITIVQDVSPSRDYEPTLDLGASPLDPLTAIANSLNALGSGAVTILGTAGAGGGVVSGGGSGAPPGSTGSVIVNTGDTPGPLSSKLTVGAGLQMTTQTGPDGDELLIQSTEMTSSIQVGADGGGAVISPGVLLDVSIPFNCTITGWTLLAEQTGSIAFDLWVTPLSGYPPNAGNSIVGSAPPAVSSGQEASSTALTGWSTSLAAGDVMRVNVSSCISVERALLVLAVTRS